MDRFPPKINKDRDRVALRLLAIGVCLELIHLLMLLLLPHPVLVSNGMQFLISLFATGVSLQQRKQANDALGRRCWTALATAFGIWSAAQAIFIGYLFSPPRVHWVVRPDDVLWLLFGLPLLIAINVRLDVVDRITWLDRAQTYLFILVLYLLVFLPPSRLKVTEAYLIQNGALLLCSLLRLPSCVYPRERRFFLRLAIFLAVYTALETAGDLLYARGWKPGSLLDLVWTFPITVFVALVLLDALRSREDTTEDNGIVNAVSRAQGLSVAVVAFLSIGVAAVLATHRSLIGGCLVGTAFLLFAARTNARERAWKSTHEQLEHTLLQDALTGLGNRIMLRKELTDRLNQAPESVVLLFADLDHFKSINDSLGHALGDRLLIEVGRRLCEASPSGSSVCRLGGDEFVVLSAADNVDRARAAGQHLLDALRAPFLLGSQAIRCTASVGVVLAVAGEEADDLLRTADHAMYRAKQLGKDRVQVFDAGLRAHMNTRWQMEADLRRLIENNEVQVAFQPIYSIQQAEICGFEALARWQHPVLGNIPPSEFITLAEDTGLILRLGSQILERACSRMAAWNRAWGTALAINVNVSPRQFADAGLMPTLLGVLERTGLPASLLRLEITETALLTHEAIVKETLEQARAHGIRISLDDFGTGYSSLSFLLSLPVDEVKVDRSFVSNMHCDANREELVRTVIHLGHSLGKRVVAEGVETERDLLGLTEMGCECVQGYLISKPLSPEALEIEFPALAARARNHPPGDEAFAMRVPRDIHLSTPADPHPPHQNETLCALEAGG